MPEPMSLSPQIRFGSSSGQPLSRRDGHLKVTGAATFAADNHPGGHALRRGRGQHDCARPRRLARRRGSQGASRRRRGDHARQPPAAGAAIRTASTACSASASTRCRTIACAMPSSRSRWWSPRRWRPRPRARGFWPRPMRSSPPASASTAARASCRRRSASARLPASSKATSPPAMPRPCTDVEAHYETPAQYHNAMEPHAMVAQWDGDRLTLDTPNQALVMARAGFARLLRHSRRRTC